MAMLRDPTNDPEFRFSAHIDPAVDHLVRSSSVQIFAANLSAERKVGSIYVVDGPPISGVASGTLFAIGNAHFLVTAAHVLREFSAEGLQIRLGMGNPERPQPLAIREELVAIDDDNDVAAILLPPEIVPRFVGKRFLGLTDVASDHDIDGWYCVLFGYLWEGTRPNRDYTELANHNFKY